jgi:hypothetical protein
MSPMSTSEKQNGRYPPSANLDRMDDRYRNSAKPKTA